jgi:hypothetical protein
MMETPRGDVFSATRLRAALKRRKTREQVLKGLSADGADEEKEF